MNFNDESVHMTNTVNDYAIRIRNNDRQVGRTISFNPRDDVHDNDSSYSSSSSDSESEDEMKIEYTKRTYVRIPDSNRIVNSYVFEKSPFRFSNQGDQSLTVKKTTCHLLKSA